jgi:hypothetical protein
MTYTPNQTLTHNHIRCKVQHVTPDGDAHVRITKAYRNGYVDTIIPQFTQSQLECWLVKFASKYWR